MLNSTLVDHNTTGLSPWIVYLLNYHLSRVLNNTTPPFHHLPLDPADFDSLIGKMDCYYKCYLFLEGYYVLTS